MGYFTELQLSLTANGLLKLNLTIGAEYELSRVVGKRSQSVGTRSIYAPL